MTSGLSFFQLLKILRQHRKLAARRDPLYESSKAAKWFVGLSFAVSLLYLIFIAVLLALAAIDTKRLTASEFIMGVMPFILVCDFWFRALAQQTPAQIVKPYLLTPLPKTICIDSFIITSLFNWGNLTWLALLIPYCLMAVVFSYGALTALSILLLYTIIILANSQWYAIIRTLSNRNILWWMVPVAVIVAIITPWLLKDFEHFIIFYAAIGDGLESGNLLPHCVALVMLASLIAINRRVQNACATQEIGKKTDDKPIKVIKFTMLDRLGELGEYLKLEVKLLSRNKNPRNGFLSATALIIVISAIMTLTEIYDSDTMANFWCAYNFAIYAIVLLSKVMLYEGNYIDVLMVHRENILKLLESKYYFYTLLLILPFVLMLPMVFVGKWDILMLVSYGIFTAGFQYFIFMQLAIYNNHRMPLNEKITTKGGAQTNYLLLAGTIAGLFSPLICIMALETFLEENTAWFVMTAIGLGFIATHKLWLRGIYNRLMKRRYKNMESFHT